MTPNELKQILTSIETVKTALIKAKETANTVEKHLAALPNVSKAREVFLEVQIDIQHCENDIAELVFPLDVQELNALLSITTKVRDI